MVDNNNSMISKEILARVVQDQLEDFVHLQNTILRSNLKKAISYGGESAFVVKGLRRCGKSTLLKQLVHERFDHNFFYFNFDEERVTNFKAEDFQTLMEVFIELFGDKKTVLFDEIQNIVGWELFVNRILRQGYHVFITGSNSNLLSKELGTHLTGRHVDLDLYPFSFAEYLLARKIEPKKKYYSTKEMALFSKNFKEYLKEGGMPEKIIFNNDAILSQVITDITQKDIVNRYNLRKPSEFRIVLNFLISNAAHPITYRSIRDNFGIKSATTVQKYVQYAQDTYLIFLVNKYERKIKLLEKNPKKVYCVDNGIITKNTPSMKEQDGDLLENIVALHLKRLGKEFYYYSNKSKSETDFVVPLEKLAIQVCYEFNDKNKEREIKGLIDGMKELKTKKGLILTLNQQQEFTQKGYKISVKPVWQWLLENESWESQKTVDEQVKEFRTKIKEQRGIKNSMNKAILDPLSL